MGSFRPIKGTPHLHGDFNFARSILETVGRSLPHSCMSTINWRGTSLLSDRHSYGRRLLGVIQKAINNFLHSPYSTGQGSDHIHYFIILHSPVFLVNSRPPRFCATIYKKDSKKNYQNNLTFIKKIVLLLPKLRSQFAEFLKYRSPSHLSILCQITCVGF